MLTFAIFLHLFIHLFFTFYDDRGEPFCETIYARYAALSGSLIKFCLSTKPFLLNAVGDATSHQTNTSALALWDCVRTDGRIEVTSFSGIHALPNFVTHGAPRAASPRSSAMICLRQGNSKCTTE